MTLSWHSRCSAMLATHRRSLTLPCSATLPIQIHLSDVQDGFGSEPRKRQLHLHYMWSKRGLSWCFQSNWFWSASDPYFGHWAESRYPTDHKWLSMSFLGVRIFCKYPQDHEISEKGPWNVQVDWWCISGIGKCLLEIMSMIGWCSLRGFHKMRIPEKDGL